MEPYTIQWKRIECDTWITRDSKLHYVSNLLSLPFHGNISSFISLLLYALTSPRQDHYRANAASDQADASCAAN